MVTAIAIESRGALTLRSANPCAKPLIDPNYLADKADLDILVAGVRQAREIAATGPLASLIGGEWAPGEQVESDEAIVGFIRRQVATLFHPTSTCAMGDGDAVCDTSLRVRGVEGLRVVDASVMPSVPRGNTNAPTIAIAERAADLIRGRSPLKPANAGE
nr:GMC oxidoreductase [Actinomadura bangladeshensis]